MELRPRKRPNGPNLSSAEKTTKLSTNKYELSDPIGTLKAGLRTIRHHTLGWLKEDLIGSGKLENNKEAIHARIWSDYNAQLIHIRAQQDILGEDYNPLHVLPGRKIEGKFAFAKNVDVPRNHLGLQYLLHAYDVSSFTFKRLRCHITRVCLLSPTKSTQLSSILSVTYL
jgi:hypothetical protein